MDATLFVHPAQLMAAIQKKIAMSRASIGFPQRGGGDAAQ